MNQSLQKQNNYIPVVNKTDEELAYFDETISLFKKLRIKQKYLQNFLDEEMEPADYLLLAPDEQTQLLPPKGPRVRLVAHLCSEYKDDPRVKSYIKNNESRTQQDLPHHFILNGSNTKTNEKTESQSRRLVKAKTSKCFDNKRIHHLQNTFPHKKRFVSIEQKKSSDNDTKNEPKIDENFEKNDVCVPTQSLLAKVCEDTIYATHHHPRQSYIDRSVNTDFCQVINENKTSNNATNVKKNEKTSSVSSFNNTQNSSHCVESDQKYNKKIVDSQIIVTNGFIVAENKIDIISDDKDETTHLVSVDDDQTFKNDHKNADPIVDDNTDDVIVSQKENSSPKKLFSVADYSPPNSMEHDKTRFFGTVVFFDKKRKFGFISPRDSNDFNENDVYFNVDSLSEKSDLLTSGTEVEFSVRNRNNSDFRTQKLVAFDVCVVMKHEIDVVYDLLTESLEQIEGSVVWFRHPYGFIRYFDPKTNNDAEVFVHYSQCDKNVIEFPMQAGLGVVFTLGTKDSEQKRLFATSVSLSESALKEKSVKKESEKTKIECRNDDLHDNKKHEKELLERWAAAYAG